MSNGPIPGPAAGLAQTAASAPGQQPQVSQAQVVGDPGQVGTEAQTPISPEQWQAYQSSTDTRISAAEQRAQQAEERAAQIELHAKVNDRTAELYRWMYTQDPNADSNRVLEWAQQVAEAEIGAFQQTEADRRDAEAYRGTRQQQQARAAAVSFAQEQMKEYGLTPDEFAEAVRGKVEPSDPDFREKLVRLVSKASVAKLAEARFQTAGQMVNSTAFPGAGGATSATEDFSAPPPGVKPGMPAFKEYLDRKRAWEYSQQRRG